MKIALVTGAVIGIVLGGVAIGSSATAAPTRVVDVCLVEEGC